jgi:integrase
LFTLKWSDVDLDGRRVRLWTRKRKGGLEQDWIPMTDELYGALSWWPEHLTFPDHAHVFVCEDKYNLARDFHGQPFSARIHWLGTLCERATVQPFGFHAIRHLSASILDDAGYPITIIQALLRHRSATTTARYLHNLRGLRAAFGDAFKRKSRPVVNTPVTAEERSDRPLLRIASLGEKAPQKAPEVHDPKKRDLHIVDFTE